MNQDNEKDIEETVEELESEIQRAVGEISYPPEQEIPTVSEIRSKLKWEDQWRFNYIKHAKHMTHEQRRMLGDLFEHASKLYGQLFHLAIDKEMHKKFSRREIGEKVEDIKELSDSIIITKNSTMTSLHYIRKKKRGRMRSYEPERGLGLEIVSAHERICESLPMKIDMDFDYDLELHTQVVYKRKW